MNLEGLLDQKQLTTRGGVFPRSAKKAHRGHYSSGMRGGWQWNATAPSTWCWFADMQNVRVRGSQRLVPTFCKATGISQCVQGWVPHSEAMRVLYKSVTEES